MSEPHSRSYTHEGKRERFARRARFL